MRHGSTPFQRWQLAGSPTIPQKIWRGAPTYRRSTSTQDAQGRLDAIMAAYRPSTADESKKGWAGKVKDSLGRFFQRRRA